MKTEIRRAGYHQPGKETNEGRQVETEIWRAGHHQPDWETNERRQVKTEILRAGHNQPGWETNEGRQVKTDIKRAGHTTRVGKQMRETSEDRDPESRTHHQPEWETYVLGGPEVVIST